MTALDLLTDLQRRGVQLSARLVFDAPAGVLTPDLLEAMKEHKAALLAEVIRLQGRETGEQPPEPPKGPMTLAGMMAGMPSDAATELQYLFDEQSGRLEFDSGLLRDDAEREALRMLPEIVAGMARGAA